MLPYICALALVAAFPAPQPADTPPPPPSIPTPPGSAVWKSDLAHLLTTLPQKHINAFAHCPKDQWLAAAAALDKRLPALSDRQAYLELSHLVAMLGDAHTSLGVNALVAPRRIPVVFAKFSDGVFIIGGTSRNQNLIGRRLVKIGGRPTEDVHARLGALVSADNDVWRSRQSLALLTDVDALAWAGVELPSPESVAYTLADAHGQTEDHTLALAPQGPGISVIRPDVQSPATLISRRQRPTWYGVDLLHGPDKVVYAWYDKCTDQPNKPTVAEFCASVIQRVDAEQSTRLIIDLRSNAGGNSLLLAPLIDALSRHETLKKPGGVYVLIGQTTFSSGMMNALQLKRIGATLVGTPTGQKPNSFGEVRTFDLPGTKLKVYYSTKSFRQVRDADPSSLMPDIDAPISSADWFDPQRDPALDEARKHKP